MTRGRRDLRDFHLGPCVGPPSSWLLDNADLLPSGGRALDVACGTGRHALLMAAAGFETYGVDADAKRIHALRSVARDLGLSVHTGIRDLEKETVELGDEAYDVVLVFYYLHRPLFPALIRALAPGGLLIYETFNCDQTAGGRPKNPDHLLEHGELLRLVAPLLVLRQRGGEFEGRMVCSIVAKKGEAVPGVSVPR